MTPPHNESKEVIEMIETKVVGNNLLIYQDEKLTYNSAVSWYTDYARASRFANDSEIIAGWITEDYLNYAEAMGWR